MKTKLRTALLIVDVINDLQFPEAPQLLRHAIPMARRLRTLKLRAHKADVPVVYVNDNFGHWQSNFNVLVERFSRSKGKILIQLLKPGPRDYFVLKPRHSAFYGTSLEILIHHLGVKRLIVTGLATDICVFFTANDAYMRGFEIVIPRDCVAANTAAANQRALKQMQKILKAQIPPSAKLRL